MKKCTRFILSVCIFIILLIGCFACTEKEKNHVETKQYKIGDVVNMNDFEVKVEKVENTNKLISDVFEDKTTINNFIVISLTVKNISDKSIDIFQEYFTLKKDGSAYDVLSDAIYYYDDAFFYSFKINAGLTKSITVVYETPSQTNEDDYVLIIGNNKIGKKEISLRNA